MLECDRKLWRCEPQTGWTSHCCEANLTKLRRKQPNVGKTSWKEKHKTFVDAMVEAFKGGIIFVMFTVKEDWSLFWAQVVYTSEWHWEEIAASDSLWGNSPSLPFPPSPSPVLPLPPSLPFPPSVPCQLSRMSTCQKRAGSLLPKKNMRNVQFMLSVVWCSLGSCLASSLTISS